MEVMRTPRSVDLSITHHCNLRCNYCSYFTSAGEVHQDLSSEEWIKFFGELNDCAVMEVCLSGGEPFSREDLGGLIQAIVRNRMRFRILTNGTLITDEMAFFLASTRRCNGVQVSIDGSIPTTHDACRGEGNFLKAVQGIQHLLRYHLPATVRVTIHKKNVMDLEGIAQLLLEEIGLPQFSTNSASSMGLCRQNAKQVVLTPEERSHAMKVLLKLTQKYRGRIGANAGPLAEARSWLEMQRARREGRESIPGKGFLTGCNGPMSKIAVRADGVIVPCDQVAHMELGRINHDGLREVWLSHPELNRLRGRRNTPLSDFEYCRCCDYVNYCTGNCPALAYTLHGEENYPSPEGCLRRFLEAGGMLPDERALKITMNG
jgi:SynChlorMet cassette radical SAM/SPASM protein ScmE